MCVKKGLYILKVEKRQFERVFLSLIASLLFCLNHNCKNLLIFIKNSFVFKVNAYLPSSFSIIPVNENNFLDALRYLGTLRRVNIKKLLPLYNFLTGHKEN